MLRTTVDPREWQRYIYAFESPCPRGVVRSTWLPDKSREMRSGGFEGGNSLCSKLHHGAHCATALTLTAKCVLVFADGPIDFDVGDCGLNLTKLPAAGEFAGEGTGNPEDLAHRRRTNEPLEGLTVCPAPQSFFCLRLYIHRQPNWRGLRLTAGRSKFNVMGCTPATLAARACETSQNRPEIPRPLEASPRNTVSPKRHTQSSWHPPFLALPANAHTEWKGRTTVTRSPLSREVIRLVEGADRYTSFAFPAESSSSLTESAIHKVPSPSPRLSVSIPK